MDFALDISPAAREALMQEVWAAATRIVEAEEMSRPNMELRGNNLAIQSIEDEQVITHGAAGTGKTAAWLHKINARSWEYHNLRVLIVRKVRADLAESVLATFERDILGYANPICQGAQRENRSTYHYPNGSLIALGGMDRPGRFLSSEWDIIYVPECNQLHDDEWQLLWSRLARDGRYPHPQICGDTNPDRPDHWIQRRAKAGELTLLPTTHKDNPKYWSEQLRAWTELGNRYVWGRLAKLGGILRKKYFEGLWVIAEGAVYDTYNEDIHVKDDEWLIANGWLEQRFTEDEDGEPGFAYFIPGPAVKRVIGGQDWGYTNPGVLQVWLIDGDGRECLVHEVYMTQKLIGWWVNKAVEAKEQWGIGVLACDPSQPAAIQEMVNAGINAVPANNDIRDGIDKTKNRLDVLEDGLPRVFIRRNALEMPRDPNREEKLQPCGLREEIPGIVWKDNSKKEEPADGENHSFDVWRYVTQEAETPEIDYSGGAIWTRL